MMGAMDLHAQCTTQMYAVFGMDVCAVLNVDEL